MLVPYERGTLVHRPSGCALSLDAKRFKKKAIVINIIKLVIHVRKIMTSSIKKCIATAILQGDV